MNPNLTTSYAAIHIERDRLPGLAERGWLAEEAAASVPQRSITTILRRSMGTMLVTLGTTLHRESGTIVPTGMADPVESTS